jgi:hypothetical protein
MHFKNPTYQAASGSRPQIWSRLQSVKLSLYCSFKALNGHNSNSGQPGKVTGRSWCNVNTFSCLLHLKNKSYFKDNWITHPSWKHNDTVHHPQYWSTLGRCDLLMILEAVIARCSSALWFSDSIWHLTIKL